jgi:hypothetical protein
MDEIWKQYIEEQKPEEPDDDLKVVQAHRPKKADRSGF